MYRLGDCDERVFRIERRAGVQARVRRQAHAAVKKCTTYGSDQCEVIVCIRDIFLWRAIRTTYVQRHNLNANSEMSTMFCMRSWRCAGSKHNQYFFRSWILDIYFIPEILHKYARIGH